MSRSDDVDIFALSDLATPWCLRVAATLCVADHIEGGITHIADLARAAGADTDMLHRVLTHLVQHGVFEEPVPGQFALNQPAHALLDGPLRRGLDLDGIGGRLALAWHGLLRQVRTGRPAYHEIFGLPFWEDLDAHPSIGASFDDLMGPAGHGAPDPEILVNGDWDNVRTIVDVGGGTGALLSEILRLHSQIRGTLVDFPRTVSRSAEQFGAAGVAARATSVGQSFFDPLPAGADIYLLSRVLNDWPDTEALAILRRCADAVSPSGRVVVVGGISHEAPGTGLSIETVLVGGRYRSLEQFRELARRVGLEVQATGYQPTGRFVVECRPRS